MIYYTYDIETYPNIFTFCGKFKGSDQIYLFEISDRIDQRHELLAHLSYIKNCGAEMVGFNSIQFDYPIIHELMTNPYQFSYQKAAQLATTIITAQRGNGVNFKSFGINTRLIPQIDIVKFCHFDNDAKRTSLKNLQFAMRSESVEDLPFKIRPLNDQEKDILRKYNIHDVTETEKFFLKHEHLIDMRRDYLNDGVLTGDVLNFSDVKIGTEYLIGRLGKHKCFAGGKPRQTFRQIIEFNKIILPKIYFRTDLFKDVLAWFRKQTIYITSSERPSLEVDLAGLHFNFGVGGVHASAANKIFHSDDEYQVLDIDVSGMYVAVAIANNFEPEHLKGSFGPAYKAVKEDRARYAKGSSRNAALKLAGNGAYGNSNNPYSPFYDPQYTFSVTVNGQLQILQLVEMIDLLPDCELIQANTDGITVRIKKEYEYLFKLWCDEWEKMTGLVLEYVKYNRMWIRDVNNYLAEKTNGELKRKGAYWYPLNEKEYEGWWNKDFSNHASIIAAEKAMTDSWPVEAATKLVTDPFDFMLRYKATGASVVYIGDKEQLKTVRYYVSKSGEPMKKISPPKGELGEYKRANSLKDDFFNGVMKEIGKGVWDARVHNKKKTKYEIVTTSIQSGWKVKECNVAKNFDWDDVDWNFYNDEAKKIIIGSK